MRFDPPAFSRASAVIRGAITAAVAVIFYSTDCGYERWYTGRSAERSSIRARMRRTTSPPREKASPSVYALPPLSLARTWCAKALSSSSPSMRESSEGESEGVPVVTRPRPRGNSTTSPSGICVVIPPRPLRLRSRLLRSSRSRSRASLSSRRWSSTSLIFAGEKR